MSDATAGTLFALGDVIRLAVAPVFLLSAVGVVLTVLTNRLARAVDRARAFEAREATTPDADIPELRSMLAVLARRARLLSYAITLCTICALLVAMVVVTLFLGTYLRFNMSLAIGAMFSTAMVCFVAGLLFFLREIYLATRALRIGLRQKSSPAPNPTSNPTSHPTGAAR
jgi:hypothetical protein